MSLSRDGYRNEEKDMKNRQVSRIANRIRAQRSRAELNRAIANADPAMRQELIAAAAHQGLI